MRHFFTHKEIKLKKKRTAIAVIGIGLVLGIYFIVSRRPAHQQETPVVAIEPVTREDVEIYGEYVGRIRAQQCRRLPRTDAFCRRNLCHKKSSTFCY